MIIYKITNNVNGKLYIGQTTHSLKKRWGEHCRGIPNTAIKSAIKKYGKDSFTIEQLDTANTTDELNEKEIYWIEKLNTVTPNGYNLTHGGVKFRHGKETLSKMKGLQAGNKHPMFGKHLSDSTKEKLRVAFTGKRNPFYGKHHSEKTKQKLREVNVGKVIPKDVIEKISNSMLGENNHFFGKTHSENAKKKISDWRKNSVGEHNPKNRKVYCIELNTVFYSSIDAQNQLNISNSLISRCCNGVLDQTNNLHFRWLEDII